LDEAPGTGRNSPCDLQRYPHRPHQGEGHTVLPAGTHFQGHVLANHEAGFLKGRARLVLELDSFQVSGPHLPIQLAADV
jgi:hypothetical protein